MLQIARHITLGAVILLIMPLAVWFSGWQWQPKGPSTLLELLYWATQTVTRPWGMITSLVLSGWMLWCLRFRLRPAIVLVLIVNGAIIAGQYTKSWIKDQVREPRPYVVWLEQHHGIDNNDFYALKRKERSALVSSLLADDRQQPDWLKSHWAFETGFSFPSGHTLFAVSWALLALGLLWPRRHIKTIVVVMVWAIAVMSSRLLLGMHWPRDLAMATVLSWLLVTVAIWTVRRFCGPLTVQKDEQKEIREREE